MNWRDVYPEGSIAMIDGERFEVRHNQHGLGIDLHRRSDGTLAVTIAPDYVPVIVDGIMFPGAALS